MLAHRILWTLVLMVGVSAVLHGWQQLRRLTGRGWLTVTAAALCIAGNWGLFIYGVAIDRVVEIALGYYMSPLCSVLLGVLVLRERPRLAQWVALGVATAAVLVISVGNGSVPWIGVGLGVSFAVYGLLKKAVSVGSTAGLTAEGVVLTPIAVAVIVTMQWTGSGTLTHPALHHPDPSVPLGRAGGRRGDVDGALDRLRADLGSPGDLHRGPGPDRADR